MEKIGNAENTNGVMITDDETAYITNYVRSIFDTFINEVCPYQKRKLITDQIKHNLIAYTAYVFCLFYNDYKNGNNDVKVHDCIKYLNHGHFSFAFKVGDNVVKISLSDRLKRETPVDSRYAITSFFYDYVYIADGFDYHLTASPLATIREFSEEELYSVYKGLRDDGYIWNDPKVENIGILGENNNGVINGRSYSSLRKDQLPGDIVVIDLDDISCVRGFSPEMMDAIYDEITYESYNAKTYKFETKYRQEHSSNRE